MGLTSFSIRPAQAEDFPSLLGLNAQWEHVTSPLDDHSLANLDAQAAYHRVAELEGEVLAFLLALGPGARYDSPNYRWFDQRGNDFIYIDRVVVGAAHQRLGLGDALYDDLLAFARRQGTARLVCEIDVEPHNAASDRFHERRGFAEVGTQWIRGGSKRVSLRELVLGRA